jgi:hypothetical protein
MQEQALFQLASGRSRPRRERRGGVALFDADWHQGVVGIVAARIKEKAAPSGVCLRPRRRWRIKGSGRSIAGLHLRDALDLLSKRAPGLLLRFGGHAMAAGVTLRESDFRAFSRTVRSRRRRVAGPADRTRTLETDGSLESGYLSIATARLLEAEVWGQGFPAPLFEDEFVVESQRILKDKHLKLRLRKGAQFLDAIQFNFDQAPGQHDPRRLPAGDQRLQRRPDTAIDDRASDHPCRLKGLTRQPFGTRLEHFFGAFRAPRSVFSRTLQTELDESLHAGDTSAEAAVLGVRSVLVSRIVSRPSRLFRSTESGISPS